MSNRYHDLRRYVPFCEQCGSDSNRVVAIYYTADGHIIRNRSCNDCDGKIYSMQSPEEAICRDQILYSADKADRKTVVLLTEKKKKKPRRKSKPNPEIPQP